MSHETAAENIIEDSELDQYVLPLRKKVRDMFSGEGSGHDFYHLDRVSNLALRIQKAEGGNRAVIGVAALLHDVHRLMKREDKKLTLPAESLATIQLLLEEVNFPQELAQQVLRAIELHEDYSFALQNREATNIETLILQDADRLEAIGAVGIARCFAFGGAHNLPLYLPDLPLDDAAFDSSTADPSSVHHFYRKLFKLGEGMNTQTAKEIATERHEYMVEFASKFFAEWKGEA